MSQEYDDEIRKNAHLFAEAETLLKSSEEKLRVAQQEFDETKSQRDRMKAKLVDYVGRNIPRRVIKLSSGSVVVISYERENLTIAEIYDML